MSSHVLDTSCLYSTLKNVSGRRLIAGYLPPHGRTLEINATFSVLGDLTSAIARGDRLEGMRRLQAFQAAIGRGDIQVLSTPSPILVDQTTHNSKMLQLNNGALAEVNPCWANSVSADPTVN